MDRAEATPETPPAAPPAPPADPGDNVRQLARGPSLTDFADLERATAAEDEQFSPADLEAAPREVLAGTFLSVVISHSTRRSSPMTGITVTPLYWFRGGAALAGAARDRAGRGHVSAPDLRARYGPWAVVTGASDGIGQALARRLAQAGLDLVIVSRRDGLLERVAGELRDSSKVEVVVVAADLSRLEGIAAVLAATAGREVGLLAAAAGFGTSGPFIDGRLEDELALIDVNCRAVAALTHHFGGRFARHGRGGLVLLSSRVAFQGVPRAANYAASKAWVQSLAEGLRVELAPRGVDVLACAPGPVRSGFGARARMRMGQAASPEVVAHATLDALGRQGTVRPGWLSELLAWSLATMPWWGRVRVMALVMGGMTRHQQAVPER